MGQDYQLIKADDLTEKVKVTADCLDDWEKNLRLGDAHLNTTAKSKCARDRFTIGLRALHLMEYDLAKEMFSKANEVEKNESGRIYPMALLGSALANIKLLWMKSDCKNAKKYLKSIRKPKKWISDKEKSFIETGFALFPNNMTCGKIGDQSFKKQLKRFMKSMTQLTRKYPEETAVKMFSILSKIAIGATNIGIHAYLKKYPRNPCLLHYTMHLFDTPDYYKGAFKYYVILLGGGG